MFFSIDFKAFMGYNNIVPNLTPPRNGKARMRDVWLNGLRRVGKNTCVAVYYKRHDAERAYLYIRV